MLVETRIRFPELSAAGVTFHANRVTGDAREQMTLTRDQVRSMARTLLWHALASDEFLEANVNGKCAMSENELELRVGDCELAMLYCAQRDVVVVRERKRFAISRVEFAWLARIQLDWVEGLEPA